MSHGSLGSADVPTEATCFHTTHWTVVLAAKNGDSTSAHQALSRLCSTYWYPLYTFIRRQGSDAEEAKDLTQAFFHHFLARHALEGVRPAAGKFRSFLLVCLKNFLANERNRAQAQRRGGGQSLISLDAPDADTRYSLEPVDNLTPEAAFERRWAFAVLERSIADLRREYSNEHKLQQFEELRGFLPGGREVLSKTELAAKRGVTVGAIDVAVHRLRQRFGTLLREQVAHTVSSEAEIKEEIRYLISVLAGK